MRMYVLAQAAHWAPLQGAKRGRKWREAVFLKNMIFLTQLRVRLMEVYLINFHHTETDFSQRKSNENRTFDIPTPVLFNNSAQY